MKRLAAATLAASLWLGLPATRAEAQVAGPFQTLPMDVRPDRSHRWAYAAIATGVGLAGSSFYFTRRADRSYHDYLVATDPDRIETLYDDAVRSDALARGTLIGGEALIALGLYLRFIRRPEESRWALALEPTRCALAVRF
ncbi:MAG TPA: hypothetical protein VEY91_05080 [Candidatus Limnocylindria bacterium]|nr:hypothetical protein [Candidatus Limnocylindria bacterium]